MHLTLSSFPPAVLEAMGGAATHKAALCAVGYRINARREKPHNLIRMKCFVFSLIDG
jgi:hypothetical protein